MAGASEGGFPPLPRLPLEEVSMSDGEGAGNSGAEDAKEERGDVRGGGGGGGGGGGSSDGEEEGDSSPESEATLPPPLPLRLRVRQVQTISGASGSSVVTWDGSAWDVTYRTPNVIYFLNSRHLVHVR